VVVTAVGHDIVGGVGSTTVMLNEQVEPLSVEHETVVVPTTNTAPEGGEQIMAVQLPDASTE
jgi:hypothetical protein